MLSPQNELRMFLSGAALPLLVSSPLPGGALPVSSTLLLKAGQEWGGGGMRRAGKVREGGVTKVTGASEVGKGGMRKGQD